MLGLALEGGGAKGAFHMGAVKALIEEGYEFDGVVGTSIGALNGAVIAQGDFELGYHWWEKVELSMLFDIDQVEIHKFLNRKIDAQGLRYLYKGLIDIIGNKGLDTKKMRNIFEEIIDEKKIRESNTVFGIVTVSVSDLKPLELYKEDIPEGKMLEYLMASANFPAFRIEPIDGKYYLDGGFYDNCPINLLIRKGYHKIFAIRTMGIGISRKVEGENVEIIDIIPSEKLGNTLIFDQDMIHTNLKMGYCDTMRVLKELPGKKYYLSDVSSEKSFLNHFLKISDQALIDIGKVMKLKQINPRRMLFEKILPGLAKRLKLAEEAGYQDIVIALLEQMANRRGIERFTIYSFSEFCTEISSLSVPEDKSPFSNNNLFEKIGLELLKELL